MGKKKQYTARKTGLPDLVDATSIINDKAAGLQKIIEAHKEEPAELARIYIAVRQMLDGINEAVGHIAEIRDLLQYKMIPETYESHGVTSQTVDDHRITVSVLVRASINPQHKEDAHEWLKEHGYSGLIVQTVNASSLAALAKTVIQDEGKELPEELFKTYMVQSVSMTKVK